MTLLYHVTLVVLLALVLVTTPVMAQDSLGNAEDAVLKDARILAQKGDFEGAIATIERFSHDHPEQAIISLELGILYYQIGEYAPAKAYLRQAQDLAKAAPSIQLVADTYLAQM